MLLGLAAAAIPLIIHLFNFRRPRKIDFSSLAFLQELQKSTMQRVRIKQLLLLILRTLAIAALVLAFARPTLTSQFTDNLGAQATSSIAIVVDNSRSMQMRDGQGAYLDQAKEIARTIVNQTTQGDEVFIVPVAAPTQDVEASSHTMRHLALDDIQSTVVSPASGTITEALLTSTKLVSTTSHLNKEVYVISDFQETSLGDSAAFFVEPALGEPRTFLVPIGSREHTNVAVVHAEVLSRIIEVGQPVLIEATVVNYGEETIEGYVTSVFIEGERVAQAAIDLEPNIPQRTQFTVTPQRRGWLSGVIQIEEDGFNSDNVRHFTLHVPEQRQLLIVRGENQQSEFIELALSSSLTEGRSSFELETIQEKDLPVKRLGAYDAIILVGLQSFSSGEVASLKEYVEEGGGVLFFPGEAGRSEDYDALFDALQGGRFAGFSGDWLQQQSIASFDRVDLEHPVFEGVFERQQGLRQQIVVENPALYFMMNYAASSNNEQTLIHLSNGFPFLQEIRAGLGSFFLFAVAPDIRWSDLPQRGLFIPLLYRCTYYLSSGTADTGQELVVGSPGEMRVGRIAESNRLALIAPDGEEYVPEQRNLFGSSVLQLDGTLLLPGIYDVVMEDQLIRRVGINLDVIESDLRTLDPNEALDKIEGIVEGPVRLLDASSADEASRQLENLKTERSGIEIWNVFLLMALIFLVAEMLVAKQWRPEAVPA